MANFNIEMYSNCLHRSTSFKMVIPTDRRKDMYPPAPENPNIARGMKTVFLLHGYTGKGDCWIPDELIDKYNFAVVCPTGENGFWLNGLSSGHAYQSFVGEELVEFVRNTFGLALKAEDTYICGMSMGGYGALHTALAYPDVFSKAIALSSAFIHHGIIDMKPGDDNGVANYDYYRECFGELDKLMESDNIPENLIKKILASNGAVPMPEIIMACGTEDFLIEPNREMHKFLVENAIAHTYDEWAGVHDMKFWNECVLKYIPVVME